MRYEQVHRSLVVQYWKELAGSKSWIEIGIASGRRKDGKSSWKGPELPRIGVRWIRNGAEVSTSALEFNWKELSMEDTLKRVVAAHIMHILGMVRDQLLAAAGSSTAFSAELETSLAEPGQCALLVGLGPSKKDLTLKIDAFTGRFAIQPASPANMRAESMLNNSRQPANEAYRIITDALCTDIQFRVERIAERAGWAVLNFRIALDNIKVTFMQDFVRCTFLRGHRWGSSNWVMAASFSLSGESWWAVEVYVI